MFDLTPQEEWEVNNRVGLRIKSEKETVVNRLKRQTVAKIQHIITELYNDVIKNKKENDEEEMIRVKEKERLLIDIERLIMDMEYDENGAE